MRHTVLPLQTSFHVEGTQIYKTTDMNNYDDEIYDEIIDNSDGGGELYEHFRIVADAGQETIRIDKFLSEHMQHSSRSRIQQAAEAGYIHANGKPVKANYKVRPGDVMTLMLARPPHDTSIKPEDIPLNIVYEDDEIMVVNKEAGMVVHPGAGNFTGTLVNAMAWHMKDVPEYDPNSPEVGLVHRIDKDTSGLLLIAKTPEAKKILGKQFFDKTTHRSYHALVWGHMKENEGRIEGNITRDPKDRLKMTVVAPESGIGKPAVTHWRVIERYGYTTLVECILETGRTHQIRAHMAFIGHPLLGDEVYSPRKWPFSLQGQTLHAYILGFHHPVTAEYIETIAPLPQYFEGLLNKLLKM